MWHLTKDIIMFNSSLEVYGGTKVVAPAPAAGYVFRPALQAMAAKVETKQSVEVERTALESAVKKLNMLVAPSLQSVQFAMDEEDNRIIVKVIDTATHKVLRQIPNEEVLAFSKTLSRLQGLVVRESA